MDKRFGILLSELIVQKIVYHRPVFTVWIMDLSHNVCQFIMWPWPSQPDLTDSRKLLSYCTVQDNNQIDTFSVECQNLSFSLIIYSTLNWQLKFGTPNLTRSMGYHTEFIMKFCFMYYSTVDTKRPFRRHFNKYDAILYLHNLQYCFPSRDTVWDPFPGQRYRYCSFLQIKQSTVWWPYSICALLIYINSCLVLLSEFCTLFVRIWQICKSTDCWAAVH